MNLYRRISVAKLKRLANPLRTPPWPWFVKPWAKPFQRKEITAYLKQQNFEKWVTGFSRDDREIHLRCIAHYVVKGWTEPIEIDVGVPALGCYVDWPIQDGNHRLAAAIYRGDKEILAGLSGDLNYIEELFG